eukprot:gene793-4081_t
MFFRKKTRKDRKPDPTKAPEKGSQHSQHLLEHGPGVYFSVPAKFLGSLQVIKSVSSLPENDRINVCREAIHRCINSSGIMKPLENKCKKYLLEYLADIPYIRVMDLRLNISVEGFATTTLNSSNLISNDPISKISFVTCGHKKTNEFIAYIAKDRLENRYCHVFQCGKNADRVIATMGQAFQFFNAKSQLPSPLPISSTRPKQQAEELCGIAALQAAPKLSEEERNHVDQEEISGRSASVFYSQGLDNTYGMDDSGGELVARFKKRSDMNACNKNSDENLYGEDQGAWSYIALDDDEIYETLADYITS